jgi:hypothetical protein
VPDRQWRPTIRASAVLWLFRHDEPVVAMALWRSDIVGMRRLDSGQIGMKLTVTTAEDAATLAASTRSWTDSDMPGPLDRAFERSLPQGDWPVFAFEIRDSVA